MSHDVVGLFAQPLTRVNINIDGVVDIFNNSIRNSCIGKSNQFTGGFGSNGLIHYHNDDNVFNLYKELKDLREEILDKSNFVYQRVMNYSGELVITNAWFNECEIGSSQLMHNHTNSVMSGTLYLRTDENTYLQFESPYGYSGFSNCLTDNPDMEKKNEYGYSFHHSMCKVLVSDGVCLFWPSYLKHGYSNNKTPNRLSLSFNLIPSSFNSLYKPYVF